VILYLILFLYIQQGVGEILLFLEIFFAIVNWGRRILRKKKSPSAKAKGLILVSLPRQDDFRNFCICDQIENVYQKLEEAINV